MFRTGNLGTALSQLDEILEQYDAELLLAPAFETFLDLAQQGEIHNRPPQFFTPRTLRDLQLDTPGSIFWELEESVVTLESSGLSLQVWFEERYNAALPVDTEYTAVQIQILTKEAYNTKIEELREI